MSKKSRKQFNALAATVAEVAAATKALASNAAVRRIEEEQAAARDVATPPAPPAPPPPPPLPSLREQMAEISKRSPLEARQFALMNREGLFREATGLGAAR